jgi:beta-glucanase (GH16 family)
MRGVLILVSCLLSWAVTAQNRKLVWADEFNYTGMPDTARWSYDTGGHGWGNNEKQYYTDARPANVSVGNGLLTIHVNKEDYKGNKYTSARVLSKYKGDWKYGRIEVRAKLPKGRGIWPAIWMLPTDWKYGGWPESGEIDIMEYVGYLPDSLFSTVHTGTYNHAIGTHKPGGIAKPEVTDGFHVYVMEWTPDKIRMGVDDNLYYEFVNEKKTFNEWPFDQRFHLLLNVAVGGNWGGKEGIDDSIFPQKMEVDYVRVYQ